MKPSGRIGSPDADQSEQPPAAFVAMTHGQISVEMLTDMTSRLARLDEKNSYLVEHIKGVEARLADGVKALDGKVDGVSRELAVTSRTVDGMKDRVDDLVHWKNKIWGMVILAAAIIAVAGGVWAFVAPHIVWRSGDSLASTTAPPVYAMRPAATARNPG